MTVGDLIKLLQAQDANKRVVVADHDGAGPAENVTSVDQRQEKGEAVIAIWIHR